MRSTELRKLMQAVLDGEATPVEAVELERQLAALPDARAEFEQLRLLFDALADVAPQRPPEGMVAAIEAVLPTRRPGVQQDSQLSAASRVLAPSSEGIYVRGDGPVAQQHQPLPPQRRLSMTQPHPPYSARRKAWIGGGIALVAIAIVVRFGFDSMPRSEDVAGTVVPAQRYRAPQATADIKLGDQSIAQLMQNDTFVKLIRDPQIQAMAKDPGFVAAAQAMQNDPQAARMMATYAEQAKRVFASSETAQAVATNAEATRAIQNAAVAANRLQASAEAKQVFAANQELAQYVSYLAQLTSNASWNAAMDKADSARLIALNAEQAKQFADRSAKSERIMMGQEVARIARTSPELQQFMQANTSAVQYAAQYAQAAQYLANSSNAAQFAAMNQEAARFFFYNAEAARLVANNPSAAQAIFSYPNAALALLSNPAASNVILRNPDAARVALAAEAAAAAERNNR